MRETIVGLVRLDAPDLSARQLAILLVCSTQEPPHTVRGLAIQLDVSRPAITRSVDRLQELRLARRILDPDDGRSVLIEPTRQGVIYLRSIRAELDRAAKLLAGD